MNIKTLISLIGLVFVAVTLPLSAAVCYSADYPCIYRVDIKNPVSVKLDNSEVYFSNPYGGGMDMRYYFKTTAQGLEMADSKGSFCLGNIISPSTVQLTISTQAASEPKLRAKTLIAKAEPSCSRGLYLPGKAYDISIEFHLNSLTEDSYSYGCQVRLAG